MLALGAVVVLAATRFVIEVGKDCPDWPEGY